MGRYSVDTVFVLLLPKYGTMIEDGELFKHVDYHHIFMNLKITTKLEFVTNRHIIDKRSI